MSEDRAPKSDTPTSSGPSAAAAPPTPVDAASGHGDDTRALSDILAAIRRLTGDEQADALTARLRDLAARRRADAGDDADAAATGEPRADDGAAAYSYKDILGDGSWSDLDPAVGIDDLADAFYAAQARRDAEAAAGVDGALAAKSEVETAAEIAAEIAAKTAAKTDGETEVEVEIGVETETATEAERETEAETATEAGPESEADARATAAPDDPGREAGVDGVWRQFEAILATANESLGRNETRLRRPAQRPEIDYFPRPSLLPEPPPSMREPADDTEAPSAADAAAEPIADEGATAAPAAPDAPPDIGPTGADTGSEALHEAASHQAEPQEVDAHDDAALQDAPPKDEAAGADLEASAPQAPADFVVDESPVLESPVLETTVAAPEPEPGAEVEPEVPVSEPPSDAIAPPPQRAPASAPEPTDQRNAVSDENRKRLERIQKMVKGAVAERQARPKREPRPPNPLISAMISGPSGAEAPDEVGDPDPMIEAAVGPDLPLEDVPQEGGAPGEPPMSEIASLLRGGLRDVLKEVVREELAKARDNSGDSGSRRDGGDRREPGPASRSDDASSSD